MSRNHFEFDMLPEDAFKPVGGKMSLFGGGGGPTETTSNVTQTNLPAYAEPFVTDIMQRGQAQSYRPYTPYENQRIAGFNPTQQQAQQETLGLDTPGQFGAAGSGMGNATMAGLTAGQQGLQAGMQGTGYGMLGGYNTAAQGIGSMFGNTADYMSPYMQGAVEPAKEQAIRDAQRGQLTQNMDAARQGTYGGARQILAGAERERNLGFTLNKLQQEGAQNAFTAAQQRQQQLGQLGMQGLQAGMQGAGQLQQTGIQGLQTGISGAQGLGQLGTAEQSANLQRLQGQYNVGARQQGLQQQQMDTSYADFLRQRDYPMEQLGYYQNLVRGMPIQLGSTATTYATPPSMVSQIAGAGVSALGLAGMSK